MSTKSATFHETAEARFEENLKGAVADRNWTNVQNLFEKYGSFLELFPYEEPQAKRKTKKTNSQSKDVQQGDKEGK